MSLLPGSIGKLEYKKVFNNFKNWNWLISKF